jgi:hypothetical protein
MAKFDLAKYAAARARAGDPYPLIGRLLYALCRSGAPLSDEEVALVRGALEATAGKEASNQLRDLEKQLIARQVDGLVDENGLPPGEAVGRVAEQRERSVRHVKSALHKYGKRRRHRD